MIKDIVLEIDEQRDPPLPPLRPILEIGSSDTHLKISWERDPEDNPINLNSNWDEYEMQHSTDELFPENIKTNTTGDYRFEYNKETNTFHFEVNASRKFSDEVVYVRVRKISNPSSGWSPISQGWTIASTCEYVSQYLNSSRINGRDFISWKCDECPEGADCVGADVTWKDVKPLFGWWRIRVWNELQSSNFSKCFYPPACLGGPNVAYRGQFKNPDSGDDYALLDSVEGCNPDFGYATKCDRDTHGRCRLCATCQIGFRRRDIGGALRCDPCPPPTTNKGLLALGVFLIGFVIGLMVFNHMGTGGKKSQAQMRKVIIINYLQTTFMIANMDVPWPDSLSKLFEIKGAVSTIGEQLLNPVCELQGIAAAELIYSKQVGYAFVVPLLGACIFSIWRVSSCILGRPFKYRGPDGRSPSLKDGAIATMVFLMYLMYPTLCRQAFALLMCKQVGDKSYMMADLQEVCFEGRHLYWVFFCSLPQFVLHVLGFPLVGLYKVYRRKKNIGHDHNKSFSGSTQIRLRNNLASSVSLFKYGMLYSAYAPQRWYWDAIIAFKKASIAFVTSFVSIPELEVHWMQARQ